MKLSILKFIILILSLGSMSYQALAEDLTNQYCVIPVKNGTPTRDDIGSANRMVSTKWQFPHIPQPIFNPYNRRGVWTITPEREWVSYGKIAPAGFLDNTETEPWSNRVVLVRHRLKDNLAVLNEGEGEFKVISKEPLDESGRLNGPYVLNSTQETVVTSLGIPYTLEIDKLVPWKRYQDFSFIGMGKLKYIYDAPSIGGVIAIGWGQELLFHNGNNVEKLGTLLKREYGRVVNVKGENIAAYITAKSIFLIRRDEISGSISLERQDKTGGQKYKYIEQFNQLLKYNPSTFGWERLTYEGFEKIPVQNNETDSNHAGTLVDIPYMKATLVKTQTNLYVYNGENLRLVSHEDPNTKERYKNVISLPSISKVLVTTTLGSLLEFTDDYQLSAINTGLDLSGIPYPKIIDWPGADIGLIISSSGLFSIDKHLNVSKINGGENFRPEFGGEYVGSNFDNGDLYLTNKNAIFAVVDTKKTGKSLCDKREALKSTTPSTELCLSPISNSDEEHIGHAIGGAAPSPSGDGMVFDAVKGLFHVNSQNEVRNLEPRGGSYINKIQTLPWSTELVIGGNTILDKNMEYSMLDGDLKHRDQNIHLLPSLKAILTSKNDKRGELFQKTEKGYKRVKLNNWWPFNGPSSQNAYISNISWKDSVLLDKKARREAPYWLLDKNAAVSPITFDGLKNSWRRSKPESYIELASIKTILVHHLQKEWFRITEDLKWERLTGLPNDVKIVGTYDIQNRGTLLGTTKGVYYIDDSYKVKRLEGENPDSEIRMFEKSETSKDIISGGFEGLYRINTKTLKIDPYKDSVYELMGAIKGIYPEHEGRVMIRASGGDFLIDVDGSIKTISNLADFHRLEVFNDVNKAYAFKRYNDGPMIYEVKTQCGEGL